jgi:ubiquinone/menaquinone biosynthesis C-methylase UbiE
MPEHLCPWWIGWALASPLRKLFYNPAGILENYVRQGMTVLEPGPGMGFFTMELARIAGPTGRVIAVDVQRQMLERLRRRAQTRGLADRIELRLADGNGMHIDDLADKVDFILAFAMAHEVRDKSRFFKELLSTLRSQGSMLISEPAWHVRESDFERSLEVALSAGFQVKGKPTIRTNLPALLTKGNR